MGYYTYEIVYVNNTREIKGHLLVQSRLLLLLFKDYILN